MLLLLLLLLLLLRMHITAASSPVNARISRRLLTKLWKRKVKRRVLQY
jgi:hypothetical protein